MENKGPYTIKELKTLSPGDQIWGKYLIIESNHRRTKDGKELCNLLLADLSGEMDAVVWDNCQISGELTSGKVIGLLGDVNRYAGKIQIVAKRIKVLDEDYRAYLPGPCIDEEELQASFFKFLNSITDPALKALLDKVFDRQSREKFFSAPGAKKVHHSYGGGLLEHSVTVARACEAVCSIYKDLHRDLLITGALLHDIGKLKELELKLSPAYTVEGRLVGHIVLGCELVDRCISELRTEGVSFPVTLEWMIKHLLLSHHGTMEFGSPVIPMFPEALVLHMLDNLDAKLFIFLTKVHDTDGDDEFFTNYDSFFGQQFFKYRYGEENAKSSEKS